MPDKGHWMVNIKAARVNGVELDMCNDGTCRGVVDIGTSHIGVPTNQKSVRQEMLTRDARDLLECRIAQAPVLEFELEAINLTVNAGHYMRRIPLREGVDVGIVVVSPWILGEQMLHRYYTVYDWEKLQVGFSHHLVVSGIHNVLCK